MSDLDRYDVEAMIRDALIDLRNELRREFDYLERELRNEIGTERVDRQDAIGSLERVLSSRTDHLV